MSSLFRRPNSPYWFAAYRSADGRRVKKSTKKTNKDEALKFLSGLLEAEKSAKNGMLTETRARELITEIFQRTTDGPLEFFTCRGWIDEWCATKKGATAERTLLKYEQICRDFLNHLSSRADLPLGAITVKDIRSFRDALVKDGHSPSNINQTVRKVLPGPFIAAQRLGYIQTNPCAGVELLKDNVDATRDVFTSAQIGELIKAADGDWEGVILAGYYTGLRLRDITELRWERIDQEKGVLYETTKKTGAQVAVPLHQELADWLRQRPRRNDKAPIFPSLAGQPGTGRSGLSMQFRRIMESAGIKGRVLRERSKKGKGREQSSLTFHSLRHSFISALANAGVNHELRQRLAGHSDLKTHSRYTHHELETLRDAVEKLPKLADFKQ